MVSVGLSRASNLALGHCRRAWKDRGNQISMFRCVSLVAKAANVGLRGMELFCEEKILQKQCL